jgi:hypothetical protein
VLVCTWDPYVTSVEGTTENRVRMKTKLVLELSYSCSVSQLDVVVEFGETLCGLAVDGHRSMCRLYL